MKEIWKAVPGQEGKYEVSNMGRVKSLSRRVRTRLRDGTFGLRTTKEIILAEAETIHGYRFIKIDQKSRTVHKLVAVAFVDKPEGTSVVNHLNGIKTDNRAENLEWTTFSGNSRHAWENGFCEAARIASKKRLSKIKICRIKLSDEQVRAIRREHAETKCSYGSLARKYGVDHKTISYMIRGKTRTDVYL